MKILMVSWAWYPTGGDWTYIENLTRLYKENGHDVVALSTQNDKNVSPENIDHYFIKSNDFKELNKNKTLANSIKVLRNSIISPDALNEIDVILNEHNDIKVAHLHNIHHHITPAIIWKLNKRGIKIIWTLHDYKIICPENSFVSNGKVCEKCISGNFYNCALNRCKKYSYPASILAAVEAYLYHSTNIYSKVDKFLCPSQFLLKKFIQFGFPESKFALTNLCYDINLIDSYIKDLVIDKADKEIDIENNYILYLGRIEQMKGVRTLINAVNKTHLKLKVVGSGTDMDNLKSYVTLNNIANVDFLGFQEKGAVFNLIYNSKFVVCPSEGYENFPFSITETFLFSKPVVASNIGGIPELVIDGQTGFLFEAGNEEDLRDKLIRLWDDSKLNKQMGTNAREHAFKLISFKTHWQILDNILKELFQ